MFSTVYRVTQKDFYAHPYTSMWAPVVARQTSKRYSSSCHVFISMWCVISSTASLTPLDYFAWGFIKDVVHRRKVRDLVDLRQHIIEAVELITPHMLINTWQELEYLEIKCQLDATEVFIADPTAYSTCFGHHYAHHQAPKSIIQWFCLWYFVLWFSSCWSGVELRVMCSGLQDAAAT